jgi:DNA invertase Pin-like site-specific DNA recombinase
LESQRRQYGLTARAQELGFHDIEVIDEDLGRSGSGCEDRPGFERLVTQVCSGDVGSVICVEASRLARNGRDWHRLIELCALVGTVIIDPEGIYDPSVTNDRLLLGLKGTMSEFELNLIRQRSREAIQQKARRGELQFRLPAGLYWNDRQIEFEPDQHVQQTVHLVFQKMEELGSVRQVFLWFRSAQLRVPVRGQDGQLIWKLPVYSSIMRLVSNPFYAGAYAFGRTQMRTRVVEGRARKSKQYWRRDQQQWPVLIRNHHPGYITWERYEQIQQTIEANTHMTPQAGTKAGRGGRALLAGLLRCRRCGHILRVNYTGAGARVLAYSCRGNRNVPATCRGVCFGGGKAEELVVEQVLAAVSGNAIEAALEAAAQERRKQGEGRRALEMAAQQARYQAHLAERRYEAVDPDQRWVAGELEARWNQALERVRVTESQCAEFDQRWAATELPSQELLVALAQDLPRVWKTSTDSRLKQRIVHIVLREIIAEFDEQRQEVTLVLHWAGGRHSEVRWLKNSYGWPGRGPVAPEEVIRKMAAEYSDDQIASTLNRKILGTGPGSGWTAKTVAQFRAKHKLSGYCVADSGAPSLTLEAAAMRLQVNVSMIRRLIRWGILPARQVVSGAPWQIPVTAIECEDVKRVLAGKPWRRHRNTFKDERQQHMFSDV